jgi:hypothetical protein
MRTNARFLSFDTAEEQQRNYTQFFYFPVIFIQGNAQKCTQASLLARGKPKRLMLGAGASQKSKTHSVHSLRVVVIKEQQFDLGAASFSLSLSLSLWLSA